MQNGEGAAARIRLSVTALAAGVSVPADSPASCWTVFHLAPSPTPPRVRENLPHHPRGRPALCAGTSCSESELLAKKRNFWLGNETSGSETELPTQKRNFWLRNGTSGSETELLARKRNLLLGNRTSASQTEVPARKRNFPLANGSSGAQAKPPTRKGKVFCGKRGCGAVNATRSRTQSV